MVTENRRLCENVKYGVYRMITLFCGNDDAAEDAAVIYSLMGCCKAAGVDFRKWLQYVLSHIHEYDHDLSLDLADFLPDNLKESGVL